MPKLSRRRLLAASVPAAGGVAAALHSVVPHGHPWEHEALAARARTRGTPPRRATAGTRASATAGPSTTRRTASTRTRSCATSTGARPPGWRTAGSCASGSCTRSTSEIEVAPGVRFAAWTYNGRIPGPTLRCREGERLRITFANGSAHPHTIHFHGIHPAEMDGVPGLGAGEIPPGRAAPSTSSTPCPPACTSTTATSARSPSTSRRASTARSSSTPPTGARTPTSW